MNEIREILTIIYNRFYLRDLFGKIVPGLIFCISIYLTVNQSLLKMSVQVNLILAIVLLGSSWVLGFCVQSFGEWIGLIRYYSKDYKTQRDFYKDYISFQKKAIASEKEDVERLVVIKEACGNFCTTLITVGLFVHLIFINTQGLAALIKCKEYWSIYIIAIFIIIFLFRMHRKHVQRQCDFIKTVLSNDTKEGN